MIEAPLKAWEARIVTTAALIVSIDTRRGAREVIANGKDNWAAVDAMLGARNEVERISRRADFPGATDAQADRYKTAVIATDRIRSAYSMGGHLMQAKALA